MIRCAAPSSIHFTSGGATPGMSTNRTGCAALISVKNLRRPRVVDVLEDLDQDGVIGGDDALAQEDLQRADPVLAVEYVRAGVCARAEEERTLLFVFLPLTAAVPSARVTTPGREKTASLAFSAAMTCARSALNALCWS